MKHLRTPRFWLLATAALIFGSAGTANAQSYQAPTYQAGAYQTGAPTMVAAAPGLPSISAEQIARDVTTEFNPRTGARELVAASFDPFEEDPNLAGSLRLRSADGAVAVDGSRLSGGAIVEMDFYYNSPSDDPYGGRNYGDVSFVNGELAPVILRDTRVLECSTRVENVVYNHASYYDRGYSSGIYRPYRHYAGHSGFGFGFGNSYFGPGYRSYGSRGYFGNNRSYGSRNSYGTHGRRGSRGHRNRDRADGRRDRDDDGRRARGERDDRARRNARRLTDRDIDERLSRVRSYGTGRTPAEIEGRARGRTPMRAGNPSQRSRIRAASPRTDRAVSEQSQTPRQRLQNERSQTQPSVNRRTRTRNQRSQIERAPREDVQTRPTVNRETRSRNSTSPKKRSSSNASSRPKNIKTSPPKRSTPKRNSAPKQRSSRRSSSPKKSIKRSAPSRRSSSNTSKRKLNFFPNDGYGARSVVSSRSIDCAREDKLRVFIPNDRLDAARFDGLTLIALDAQGGETPIYLPPNYIEGYRMAATGRVRAQGIQTSPQYSVPQPAIPQYTTPQYIAPAPRTTIEAAPCPSGTTKQADGTCLQVGSTGYPYR